MFAYEGKITKPDALDRAYELMRLPNQDIPPLALKFADQSCNKKGVCLESIITAYVYFAQVVEGCPCENASYKGVDLSWLE